MEKKKTLKEILDEMNVAQEANFNADHNPKEYVKVTVEQDFPEEAGGKQEDITFSGESMIVICHKGNGEFASGITGAMGPKDAMMFIEAMEEAKSQLMKQVASSVLGRLLGGLADEE